MPTTPACCMVGGLAGRPGAALAGGETLRGSAPPSWGGDECVRPLNCRDAVLAAPTASHSVGAGFVNTSAAVKHFGGSQMKLLMKMEFGLAVNIAGCFLQAGGDVLSHGGKGWNHEPSRGDNEHQHHRKKAD